DASYGKLGNKSPSLCVSDHTKHKRSSPSLTSSSSSSSSSSKNPEGRSSTNSSISRADSRSPDRPVSASTSHVATLMNGKMVLNGGAGGVGGPASGAGGGDSGSHKRFSASELSKSDDGLKHKSLSEVPVSNNSSSSSPAQTVHPIIRSGVEVLQGQMAAAAASHGFGSYPFAQSQMYAQSQAQGYPSLGYDPAALLRSAPFYYPHLFGGGAAAAAAVNNHAAALANAYRPYMTVHHQLSNCRDPFCVGQCQQTVPSPVMPST
ncbi:unnamed protein product, partial [Notodromas monacha]